MQEMDENVAQWAIDLLDKDRSNDRSIIGKHLGEIIGAGCFGFAAPLQNFIQKNSFRSPIHIPIIAGLVGAYLGHWLQRWSMYRNAKQYTVMIDYIRLHPERFPPPENRKFADILKPWIPIR